MKLKKVLCGVTAAVLIFEALQTPVIAESVEMASVEESYSRNVTEDFYTGIKYVDNGDGTCTITEVPSDVYSNFDGESFKMFVWSFAVDMRDKGVTEIKVDPKIPYFFSEDGMLVAKKDGKVILMVSLNVNKEKTYTIPNGITDIMQAALDESIEVLNIPASVKYISDYYPGSWNADNYFRNLKNLKQINVDPKNTVYFSSDGALYAYDDNGDRLIRYPFGRSGGDFIVSDGISDLRNLYGAVFDSIYIPVSAEVMTSYFTAKDIYYAGTDAEFNEIKIGDFYGDASKSLYNYCRENNINVHCNAKKPTPSFTKDGITYEENEDGTLTASVAEDARKTMQTLTVPETVNEKKVTAFSMIEEVHDYGYGPTYIGYTLPELKSISLPASLKEFEICEDDGDPLLPKLSEIKVDSKNTVFYAEDNVLFKRHDKGITMVLYPAGKTNTSYTIPEGVTDSDFRLSLHSDSLKTLNFPATLSDIGDNMSQGAGRSLNLGYYFADVDEVNVDPNNKAFASVDGCLYDKSMTTLMKYGGDSKTFVIPDGVSQIERTSFDGETIYIPKSVYAIGDCFLASDNTMDIYYEGSEEEWNQIAAVSDIYRVDYISYYVSGDAVHFNTPLPIKPAVPSKPKTSSVTTEDVTLTWNEVDGATEYIIKISSDDGETWNTQTVSENSISLSDLTPNTVYTYKIAAMDGDIGSGFSEEYTFKTEKEEESLSDEDSKPSKDDRDDEDENKDEDKDKDKDKDDDHDAETDNEVLTVIIIAIVVVVVVIAAAVIVVILVLKKKKSNDRSK